MRDLNICQCQQCAERQRINAEGLAKMEALRKDAERYRWLRGRDLETVHAGGVFAGQTPQNVVLNGEDLDNAIDASMGFRWDHVGDGSSKHV